MSKFCGVCRSYLGHPDQQIGYVSYAQHFDDGMILNLFRLMGIPKPSYLDLGAHSPFDISNTALLYYNGSRGVNVEANPNLIKEFEKHRPEDINVNVGVGLQNSEMTFYQYSDTSGRNTFSKAEVESLKGIMTVQKEAALPVKTLAGIVSDYCNGVFPDLLSCDIEGLDYDVLNSSIPAWSRNSPKLICVETRRNDTGRMRRMVEGKGYILYCRMGENLFFVRKDFEDVVYWGGVIEEPKG